MRVSTTGVRLALVLTLAASCGKSPDGPAQPAVPRLKLAGVGQVDTIGAAPAQALVAQVLGPDGQPVSGAEVDFQVPGDSLAPSGMRVTLSPETAPLPWLLKTNTDVDGRAQARVRFSTLAGPARVIVTAPGLGLADTAAFLVQPGATTGVRLFPRDTALPVQGSFRFRARAVDRAGNPRSDSIVPTYQTYSDVLQLDGAGDVTTLGQGRGYVRVVASWRGGMLLDSAGVSVVPTGRVLFTAQWHGPLELGALTGGPVRTIVASYGGAGAWSPAHDLVAFCNDQGIGVTDTLGNARMLPAANGGCWPQFSPDGQWIYYDASGWIRRIHPDGTGADSLYQGQFVTVAPDGSRLAFEGTVQEGMLIADLRTGAEAQVPDTYEVTTPRWSPDGQMIAFMVSGGVRVLHPDGSAVRNFAVSCDTGLGWSPDSRYVVAASDGPGSHLLLLDVTTGAVIPLPLSGLYPSWAP